VFIFVRIEPTWPILNSLLFSICSLEICEEGVLAYNSMPNRKQQWIIYKINIMFLHHLLKTSLHYEFLMIKLCRTFVISLWIVNRFKNTFYELSNITSLLQWPLTQFAYSQSSKCPPLASTQATRRDVHQLRYQPHSVEGRAKCPTVPQLHELVIGTRAAGQGSK